MGGASLFAGCHLFTQEANVPEYIQGAPNADPLENLVGVRNVYTVCGLCPGNCGIRCRVAQGMLVKIGGSPFHPASTQAPLAAETPLEKALTSGGSICAEGGAGVQTLYDPFRVVRPLKRIGNRGCGKWTAITWDQALTEIVEGGNLFGEGIVPGIKRMVGSEGAFQFILGGADWGSTVFVKRWLQQFSGASLVRNAEVYQSELAAKAGDAVFGMGTGAVDALYDRAACVISFGDAPLDSGEPLVATARLIAQDRSKAPSFRWAVVDPRFSTSAGKSDLWVPVLPGKDRELALGIMRSFLDKYPESLCLPRDIIENLVRDNTADSYARACGLPVEMIRQLADWLAQGGVYSAVVPGRAIYGQPNGLETAKTILMLNAMVGSDPGVGGLARYGCRFFDRAAARLLGEPPTIRNNDASDPQGLMVWMANPVYESPTSALSRFLDSKKMPLLIVIDRQITETASAADYILPDTTYLERWDICQSPPVISEPGFGVRSPVVGAVNPRNKDYLPIFTETKTAEDILALIGSRLGLKGFLPDDKGRIRNACSWFEEGIQVIWDEMQHEDSITGKVSLDLSAVVERGGFFLHEAKSRPVTSPHRREDSLIASKRLKHFSVKYGHEDEDLILICYTLPFYRSGRSVVNSWLLEVMPENRLLMNTEDARRRSITQGAKVRIEVVGGGLSQKCYVNVLPGVRPGVVALAKGYGHTQFGAATNEVDGIPRKSAEPRGTGINTGAFLADSGIVKVRVTRV